ncbi:MAG: hypothetical protein ACKVQW_11320 [Pyrinomonadaceae bacterium]
MACLAVAAVTIASEHGPDSSGYRATKFSVGGLIKRASCGLPHRSAAMACLAVAVLQRSQAEHGPD